MMVICLVVEKSLQPVKIFFFLYRDTVTSSHGVRVAAGRGSELQLLPFNFQESTQTKTPALNNKTNI